MDLKERIISVTIQSLMRMGASTTTMDSVAKSCGISKRTLYEQFPDKVTLIREALKAHAKMQQEKFTAIFNSCDNQLDALLKVYYILRDEISATSSALVQDIQRLYPALYNELKAVHAKNNEGFVSILRKGQEEGMILKGINLEIFVTYFNMTMHNIKMSNINVEKNIPLTQILDGTFLVFLRGVATQDGVARIDEFIRRQHESII